MKGKYLFSKREYVKIYKRVPRICVELIIREGGGVMLVKRGKNDLGPGKGKWHLPGKGILYGESVKRAIERTAGDETGLKVAVRKFLGFKEYRLGVAFGHSISLVFLVDVVGGKPKSEAEVFEKLPKNIAFGHRAFLSKVGFK